MSIAFVLVQVIPGKERETKEALQTVTHVKGVYRIYGIYDLIVELEARSNEDIRETIASHIRSLKHVHTTVTLLSASGEDTQETNKEKILQVP